MNKLCISVASVVAMNRNLKNFELDSISGDISC